VTTLAFALVLSSAFMHATWNFLLKRSHNKQVFFWCICAVGLVLIIIPAVVFAVLDGITWQLAVYGLGTMSLHGIYATAITRGYHLGDLSTFYPVSRGMGPALVPILAIMLLGEHVSVMGGVGIAVVLLGIYVIHIDSRIWRDLSHPARTILGPSTRLALLTGLVIASYTLWDKNAVDHDVSPMTLNGFSMMGNFLALTPVVLAAGATAVRDEWSRHSRSIVAAGVLAPLGYALVLFAMTTSRVSYITPVREVGIVIGTLLGVWVLGEGYGWNRVAGSVLIVAGVITIALAP
jgi:drug/metabolite transporter (DMT)-like permease